jgi:hypothetical protein
MAASGRGAGLDRAHARSAGSPSSARARSPARCSRRRLRAYCRTSHRSAVRGRHQLEAPEDNQHLHERAPAVCLHPECRRCSHPIEASVRIGWSVGTTTVPFPSRLRPKDGLAPDNTQKGQAALHCNRGTEWCGEDDVCQGVLAERCSDSKFYERRPHCERPVTAATRPRRSRRGLIDVARDRSSRGAAR